MESRERERREKERGGGKEVVVLVEIHDAHAMGGVSHTPVGMPNTI